MISLENEIITFSQLDAIRRFDRSMRKAFNLNLLNSIKNSSEQHMLLNNKQHMRKLLKEGKINREFLKDLKIQL